MNRVFYVFRHGETDWNKERRCQGHTNTLLNEIGVSQAHDLALKMANLPIEIIYSSDLERSKMTGLIVSNKLNLPIIFDSRLREMSYGVAEGLIFQDAIEKYGEELWIRLQSFKKSNDDVCFPKGETRLEARSRLINVIEEIIEKTTFQTIALSTHGGALRNLLHYFLPEDHPIIPIPNCVVYRLEYLAAEKKFIVDLNPL